MSEFPFSCRLSSNSNILFFFFFVINLLFDSADCSSFARLVFLFTVLVAQRAKKTNENGLKMTINDSATVPNAPAVKDND